MWSGKQAAGRRAVRVGLLSAVSVIGVVTLAWPHVAFADTPAPTDFGQAELSSQAVEPAFVSNASQAMFLTVYDDGRNVMEVRRVRGDAINAFAGDHLAWRLDDRMTWLIQMPVYVRELSGQTFQSDRATV